MLPLKKLGPFNTPSPPPPSAARAILLPLPHFFLWQGAPFPEAEFFRLEPIYILPLCQARDDVCVFASPWTWPGEELQGDSDAISEETRAGAAGSELGVWHLCLILPLLHRSYQKLALTWTEVLPCFLRGPGAAGAGPGTSSSNSPPREVT